jgi:hypothetical protein
MTQIAFVTKWQFVVEFEDQETGEISGTIGRAGTWEECESLIEYDVQYHRDHERTVLNAEAGEICAACEGEGQLPIGNGGCIICQACGGHQGAVSTLILRP